MIRFEKYLEKQGRIMEQGTIEQKFQAEKNFNLAKRIKSNIGDLKFLSDHALPIHNNFLQNKSTHPIDTSTDPVYNKLKKYVQDRKKGSLYANLLIMKMELRQMDKLEYAYIEETPSSNLEEEFIMLGKSFQEVSINFKNSPHLH